MNLLMIGSGKGSWSMRGQQLGAALGARVTSTPTDADWRWADRVVLVKNHGAKFAAEAHRVGVPIVWDVLDFWSQPRDNQADATRAVALFHAQARVIKPALVVCATEAMAQACGGVYLPHHSWAGLAPTAARADVKVVAYEGNPLYLGGWAQRITEACKRRGWTFAINPPDLSQADLLVALRDGIWDGWICRQWKSGVKVVNAIAAGRPIITQETAAFRELNPVGCAIDSPAELERRLDLMAVRDVRQLAADQPLARTLTLHQVAARYRLMLQTVEASCTV